MGNTKHLYDLRYLHNNSVILMLEQGIPSCTRERLQRKISMSAAHPLVKSALTSTDSCAFTGLVAAIRCNLADEWSDL